MTVGKPVGGILDYVYPDKLQFDSSYQRKLDPSRAQKLAEHFNPDLFDPIVISRRADKSLWVIDGQHRARAAVIAKIELIPARILDGLTPEQEAKLFVDEQMHRVRVNVYERYTAMLRAGDEKHTAVQAMLAEFGYTAVEPTATANPWQVRPITLILNIYRSRGADHLRRLLTALRPLSVLGETIHLTEGFMSPLSAFMDRYSEKLDFAHLTEALKTLSIEKLIWKASRIYQTRGGRRFDHMIDLLYQAYNQSNPPRMIRTRRPLSDGTDGE